MQDCQGDQDWDYAPTYTPFSNAWGEKSVKLICSTVDCEQSRS